VRGATVVWCGGGEGEREEQKQMVCACVEQRERRWRAWSERGVSVASRSERFCVYCMPRLFFSVVLSLGTESRKCQQSKRERAGRMP